MAPNDEIHRRIDEALSAGVKAKRVGEWLDFEKELLRDPGIDWQPPPGTIVCCDYGPGMASPEMRKERKAVIISPRIKWEQLCIVVPISSRAPRSRKSFHIELTKEVLDERFLDEQTATLWVKCDCVSHVSLKRLRGWHVGGGERIFYRLPAEKLAEIRLGVLFAIGAGEALDVDGA